MSVSDGQKVNASVTNAAFMSRLVDTSTIGTVALQNITDVNSGNLITNLQQLVNEIRDTTGVTAEGDATRKIYSSNNVVTDGDDRKVAIGKLDGTFDTTTGHSHDGVDSAQIDALDLLNIDEIKRSLLVFADDASFEAALVGAPIQGDIYLNSTDDKVRYYNSIEWRNLGGDVLFEREIPTGLVNGLNTVYTMSQIPSDPANTFVYLDGAISNQTEYSISTNEITFVTAPQTGQYIEIAFLGSGTVSPVVPSQALQNVEYVTITAGNEASKSFSLSNTPATASKTVLDIVGGTSQVFGIDFTVSGSTLSWTGLGLDGILVEDDIARILYDSL